MPTTLSHTHTDLVTRDQLREVAPPAPTSTWKPIGHYDLIHALDRQLAVREIRIVKEAFALSRNGLRLFGILDLEVPGVNGASGREYNFAMGIRTANDRSFATQIAVGATVFVCDNLAFSGDLIAMNRKHTAKFDLNADISRAVDKYQTHLATFGTKIETLKLRDLRDWEAKEIIFDAFHRDVVPLRLFDAVAGAYFSPQAEDAAPRNAWGLHNAFTGCLKQLALGPAFAANVKLGKLFGLTSSTTTDP